MTCHQCKRVFPEDQPYTMVRIVGYGASDLFFFCSVNCLVEWAQPFIET